MNGCAHVVAKILRITEHHPGAAVVIGQPGSQRQASRNQPKQSHAGNCGKAPGTLRFLFAAVRRTGFSQEPRMAEAPAIPSQQQRAHDFPGEEGKRSQQRRLLGQSGQAKPERGRQRRADR